jgi:hypothetical protein
MQMNVKELITIAERCRRLSLACNDDILAGQFRAVAHQYLERARQLGTHTMPRRYYRPQRYINRERGGARG